MSTVLYELPDRYVLDTGEVVGKHIAAMRLILSGKPLDGRMFLDNDDLRRFATDTGQTLNLWSGDGEEANPAPETFNWNIPEKYRGIAILDYCVGKLEDHLGLQDDSQAEEKAHAYIARLEEEVHLIEHNGMIEFIQSLIYIIDVFRANKVVWGVGRGSSVESLVLFLIGVHRIDPVQHEIPLEHFFRDTK